MNVVALESLDEAVKEAARKVINGLVKLRALCPTIVVEQDIKLDFQCTVVVKDGLNAIPRVQTATPGKAVTTAAQGQAEETTEQGAQSTQQQSSESGQQSTEQSTQQTSGSESQSQNYGRRAETIIEYES